MIKKEISMDFDRKMIVVKVKIFGITVYTKTATDRAMAAVKLRPL